MGGGEDRLECMIEANFRNSFWISHRLWFLSFFLLLIVFGMVPSSYLNSLKLSFQFWSVSNTQEDKMALVPLTKRAVWMSVGLNIQLFLIIPGATNRILQENMLVIFYKQYKWIIWLQSEESPSVLWISLGLILIIQLQRLQFCFHYCCYMAFRLTDMNNVNNMLKVEDGYKYITGPTFMQSPFSLSACACVLFRTSRCLVRPVRSECTGMRSTHWEKELHESTAWRLNWADAKRNSMMFTSTRPEWRYKHIH